MGKILAIAKRDVSAWLGTFSFYFLLALFFGVTGYFFWSNVSYFSLVSFQAATNPAAEVRGLNLIEGVFSPFVLNMCVLLLLLIPLFTMRSFSEEKRLGTFELLATYPVSDIQIVLGKFLSLLILLLFFILPTLSYFYLAQVVGAHFELSSLLSGYLGLFLAGMSFVALGMWMSSLTEHQAVSAGIGFVILLFFWVVGWIAQWASPLMGSFFRELSLVDHLQDFTRGIIDTKHLAYFIFFIGFFLFSTLSALEVRAWKR